MNLVLQQVIALTLVYLEKAIFTLVPVISPSFEGKSKWIGRVNCAAGGILISAALVDLLPQAIVLYDKKVRLLRSNP